MFNLQGSEIIVILLLALVVLGPEKLPGAIRRATKTYAELRKMGSSFQDEVKSAFDEPMREVRETADLIKQQVDVDALEAEQAASVKDGAAQDGPGQDGSGEERATAETPPPAEPPPADEPNHGLHESNVLPPPVAGSGRPGPNAIPVRPSVPPPPPPFSGSNGAQPSADTNSGTKGATPALDGQEETSP